MSFNDKLIRNLNKVIEKYHPKYDVGIGPIKTDKLVILQRHYDKITLIGKFDVFNNYYGDQVYFYKMSP